MKKLQFEVIKKLELNDLKNKANLAQKIILMLKTLSLNN